MLFALFLHPASSCIEQKSSLLQFLARLSQYGGLTLSWQNSTDCCTWEGVACGADGAVEGAGLAGRRDKQRVLELTGETNRRWLPARSVLSQLTVLWITTDSERFLCYDKLGSFS
jgi:hypothetical protein